AAVHRAVAPVHADRPAKLEAPFLAAGGEQRAVIAALGDLDLPEVEGVEHLHAGLLQRSRIERGQVRAKGTRRRPPSFLDRALGGVNQAIVDQRLRLAGGGRPAGGEAGGGGRLTEGDAAVGEREVQRTGEGGLHLGNRQVVVLEHQRAGRVEGEVRTAAGVDATLVLLGEVDEQRLRLEVVRGELAIPGE